MPTKPRLNLEKVREQVNAWYSVKRQAALLGKKLDGDKDDLKKLVEEYGQADTDGHVYLDLGGLVGDRKIAKLKNQRRTSQHINLDVAETILRKKKLWDELTYTITQIDQDKLFAAYFDNAFTEAEWSQMIQKDVAFSFILVDDEGRPVS